MTINVSDKLDEVVETSDVPVLAYFSADWCGPCRVFRPRMDALAKDSDEFVLVHIDIDENSELTEEYNVRSVPTVVGFVGGEEGDRFNGVTSNSRVQEFIEGLK